VNGAFVDKRSVRSVVPGILFLVAVALYAPRLEVPSQYMFDEVYHAFTAGQYVAGNPDAYVWNRPTPRPHVAYMWNHPPAGVLLISGGILLWGDVPFGWRFASVIFGAAGIVLTYRVALAFTRDRLAAVLAASLLLLDGLYFVQSRIAMLDIFGTVFSLAALLSLHSYLKSPGDRCAAPIVRTGAFLGLALATKWNAAYLSLLVGLVMLWRAVRLARRAWRDREDPAARAGLRVHLVWLPVGLVLVPALVYVVTYLAFFAAGHGVGEFVELQKQIFYYHTRLRETHPYQSSWWQWPLELRPVWYWMASDGEKVANLYAGGNPLLEWLFLPAVAWLAVRFARERRRGLAPLLIGFFGQWLPWALVPRIAFAYHFLPAVPWGALAVGAGLAWLWRRGPRWRMVAAAYVLLVVGAFLFFYPIWSGVPLERPAFEHRLWLASWR
jgi:dolichyl-phosphate-mannose--protein O-mannosyl transferase